MLIRERSLRFFAILVAKSSASEISFGSHPTILFNRTLHFKMDASTGTFLAQCPPEIWEAVFLQLDVPSLWLCSGVCQEWRFSLTDETFSKALCGQHDWDYEKWIRKKEKRESKAESKAARKGFRKRDAFFDIESAGAWPWLRPVRMYARQRYLKEVKRAMVKRGKPAAMAAMRNRELRDQFHGNALGFVNHVLQLDPDFGPFLNKRALLMLKTDRYAAAQIDLEHAVELYPLFGDALNNLALVMHEIGDPRAALPLYARALALEGEAVTLNNRALCLNELGRHVEAVTDFTFILKWLSPRNVDAFNNRAFSYNSLGRHDLAVADCEVALARKPHLAEPRRIRAFAFYKLGRLEEAVLEATHAIELFDGIYEKAHYTRGLALRAMAEAASESETQRDLAAKADEDMRIALEKSPNVAEDL